MRTWLGGGQLGLSKELFLTTGSQALGLPDPGTELILVLLMGKRKTTMAIDGFPSPLFQPERQLS